MEVLLLGRYLKEKRLFQRLTQKELARILGYKAQYVANWERGACKPPVAAIAKIGFILKIDKDDLLRILMNESYFYWQKILNEEPKDIKR